MDRSMPLSGNKKKNLELVFLNIVIRIPDD